MSQEEKMNPTIFLPTCIQFCTGQYYLKFCSSHFLYIFGYHMHLSVKKFEIASWLCFYTSACN